MMQALSIVRLDGPRGMELRPLSEPLRAPGEVLLRVHAVAPAFPDLLLSRGEYQVKPEVPFTPGSDFAGTVIEVDKDSGIRAGDRVAGCLSFGAAAEMIAAPEDRVYPLPDSVSFGQGAALPMNYLTAYYALAVRGQAKPGERVLVTGASGGVGTASIQVAAGLGCHVTAIVSSPERIEPARQAGAHAVELWDVIPEGLRANADGRGMDVVIDVVGGEDMRPLLRTLAPGGRLMVVGFASGKIPSFKASRLLLTNTDVRGVESARMFETGESRSAWTALMAMVEQGFIRPVISDGGHYSRYGEVLEAMSTRATVGRVVLSVGAGG